MNIKSIRQDFNLSQAELGRILGVTGNALAKLERGETPISKAMFQQLKALQFLIDAGLFTTYAATFIDGEYEEYRRKYEGYK